LAAEVFLGVFGITLIIEFNEGIGSLQKKEREVRGVKRRRRRMRSGRRRRSAQVQS
jgi:hypothetical protein